MSLVLLSAKREEAVVLRRNFRLLVRYYQRTTVIALQAEFPTASYARTITTLSPVTRGTCADQLVVPAAVPEPPVDVDHVTEVTPELSAAVPVTVRDAAVVLRIVEAGEVIRSDGGVGLALTVGVPGVGVDC
jgi:hypothetical protein